MSLIAKIYAGSAALVVSTGIATATPVVNFERVSSGFETVWNDFMPDPALRIVENFDGGATPGRLNTGAASVTVDPDAQDTDRFSTPVGTFSTLSPPGSTVGNASANNSIEGDASELHIRSGNNFGRFNPIANPSAQASATDANFLDSNDTLGIRWTLVAADFTKTVRSIQAFLTDPADAGKTLTLSFFSTATPGAPVVLQETVGPISSQNNGTVWHFTAAGLDTFTWDTLIVDFEKSGIGDGIGLSNVAVAVIPLPAPALMVLLGLGGLFGLRRFRTRPAA